MADRRPVLFRNGTVLTMDDTHTVLTGADVLVVDDTDRRGRHRPVGARRRAGGRRHGRHRDAGHDRHPPAHVADGDAGLRRRLDPDAVLRLVLPRARQALPPRGHPRRQRAVGLGVARGRGHHHGRLVARPADPDHADAAADALESVPGRFVLAYGNIQAAPWEWTADPAVRSFFDRRRSDATCSASSSPSTSPATRRSRSRRPTRSPATSAWPSPRTRACGARPTTTASGSRTRTAA